MKEAIERAVKLLAEKITAEIKSEDALRFTQAADDLLAEQKRRLQCINGESI